MLIFYFCSKIFDFMNLLEKSYKLLFILLFIPFFLCAEGKKMVVVIDPGHGGKDVGAMCGEIQEKNIVMNIGLKLGTYIEKKFPDVNVIYTRGNDTFVPLHQRVAIANQNKADLFISLHANYCDIPSITGTETFILGLHRSEENLEVAKKENSVILFEEDHSERYEGFDPNLSESYIMFELIQDEFLDQSASFANQIQHQFNNRADRRNRGVKQAGFLVLRRIGMPGVLIETGFLSNPDEAGFLNSDKGQDYMALAIFRAFCDYKNVFDSKSQFSLTDTGTPEAGQMPQTKPEANLNKPDSIYFSLQLAAVRKKLDTNKGVFKGLNNVWHIQVENVFKYYYGKETSLQQIKDLKTKLEKRFPDSFIVAFKNEKRISVSEALKLVK